ncbi:MAG: hypothetical protein KDJ74_15260 [Notoacmeibacter sp.]|nr:hypothetical protein [Notoacmeibacter sp.]
MKIGGVISLLEGNRLLRAAGAASLVFVAGPPIGGIALGLLLGFWQLIRVPQKLIEASFSPVVVWDAVAATFGGMTLFALFSHVAGWLAALVSGGIFAVAIAFRWPVTMPRMLATGLAGGIAGAIPYLRETAAPLRFDVDQLWLPGILVYCSLAASAGIFFICRRLFPSLLAGDAAGKDCEKARE